MLNIFRNPLVLFCGLALIAAGAIAAAFTIPHSSARSAPSKNLVLIGGGLHSIEDDNEIYRTIVKLAGGPQKARIGIIPAGSKPSRDPDDSDTAAMRAATRYAERFSQVSPGIHTEWIPIDLDHVANNSSPEIIRQINSMTGFFLGGGRQTRFINSLALADRTPSPALDALHAKFTQGTVVAGTSAGSVILSSAAMFTPGGESYEAFRYGPSTEPTQKKDHLYYDPQGGFDFFPYGLVDTHFSERGRQGRLISVGLDSNEQRGFGIDEDTALVVTNIDTPDASMQVIGEGGVTITNLSNAKVKQEPYTSAYGTRMSYLTHDDRYSPVTGIITFASWKSPITTHQQFPDKKLTSRDIFSSPDNEDEDEDEREGERAFTRLATRLVQSDKTSVTATTYESDPRYTVRMTETTSSNPTAYNGTYKTDKFTSYENMQIDIYVEQPG